MGEKYLAGGSGQLAEKSWSNGVVEYGSNGKIENEEIHEFKSLCNTP